MITIERIMSTRTCSGYPVERVTELLALPGVDASSWVRLAESCRDLGWPVPQRDLRLTVYRAASPASRLAGRRRSIGVRVRHDRARHERRGSVPAGVISTWDALARWASGDDTVDLAADAADAAADAADAAAWADAADAAAAATDRAECRRGRFAEPWDAASRAEAADYHAHRVDWRARYFTGHADGFRAGFKAAIAWAIDRRRIPTETMTEAAARLLAEEGRKR